MKSLVESLQESLLNEANLAKIIKDAEHIFKKFLNKSVSIEDEIDPLIHDNYDVDDNDINHTEGLIFFSDKKSGWTIVLDSGGDWDASKKIFAIHEIKATEGSLSDDKVWDAVYDL